MISMTTFDVNWRHEIWRIIRKSSKFVKKLHKMTINNIIVKLCQSCRIMKFELNLCYLTLLTSVMTIFKRQFTSNDVKWQLTLTLPIQYLKRLSRQFASYAIGWNVRYIYNDNYQYHLPSLQVCNKVKYLNHFFIIVIDYVSKRSKSWKSGS